MTKGRSSTCQFCSSKVNKEGAILHSKKYYHENCFKEMMELRKDRQDLIDYICKLYKLEIPTGQILKQIKDFTDPEQYGYKLKGIRLALQYFHETLGNPVREGDGIGIVPYVYEEAKRHYILKMKVEASVQEYKEQKHESNIIEIKSPELNFKRKINSIDIGSL